jgi:hypothetical protein
MHALLLTVFVSLVLVVFFAALFLRERTSRDTISSAERDALLPFDDGDASSASSASPQSCGRSSACWRASSWRSSSTSGR